MALRHLRLAVLLAVVISSATADEPEKIVGGSEAGHGEFPYQVSLKFYDEHICGGTLITDRHVLTAAHCVYELIVPPYRDFTVVSGTINSESGGQTHRVKNIVIHNDYIESAAKSFRNDIAVITLASPYTQNAYQRPIPVATVNPPLNAPLIVSGWGIQKLGGPQAVILQKATLYGISNQECQAADARYTINDSHLCARNQRGIGACHGDSGGPLVFRGELVGIASWVYPCALGKPDVFTRVPYYLDFINNVIRKG